MTSISRQRSHREIDVWQEAVALAEKVDRLAGALPVSERFGRGGRLRSAAGAVPVRIAAGHGCGHRGGYLGHLAVALESLTQLQLELVLAARHQYLTGEDAGSLDQECGRVRRLLGCLAASLHTRLGASEAAFSSQRLDLVGHLPVTSASTDRLLL